MLSSAAIRRVVSKNTFARCNSTGAVDHQTFLKEVASYPVKIPYFHWTLEFCLPTPMPAHQFNQMPLVIEVPDRNTSSDDLVYSGPNVISGYTNPLNGSRVNTIEENIKLRAEIGSEDPGTPIC